jgi:hypothetical protein
MHLYNALPTGIGKYGRQKKKSDCNSFIYPLMAAIHRNIQYVQMYGVFIRQHKLVYSVLSISDSFEGGSYLEQANLRSI